MIQVIFYHIVVFRQSCYLFNFITGNSEIKITGTVHYRFAIHKPTSNEKRLPPLKGQPLNLSLSERSDTHFLFQVAIDSIQKFFCIQIIFAMFYFRLNCNSKVFCHLTFFYSFYTNSFKCISKINQCLVAI